MIELNQIHLGDCLELMKEIPDKSVDLVFTSPPYNLDGNRKNGGKKFKVVSYNSYQDNLPVDEYFTWIKNIVNELIRVTKWHVFFNINEYTGTRGLIKMIYENYFNYLKEDFIWFKNNPPSSINDTSTAKTYEHIFCFSHDCPQTTVYSYSNFSNRGGDYMRNGIRTNVNSEKNGHNFAFPLNVPKHFVKYFSKPCDLIFDPFSGSGTTAIACLELNRNFICIESDKKYWELSVKRVNDYKSQTKMEFEKVI